MTMYPVDAAIRAIHASNVEGRPVMVAIDGRSGVGKSSFASALAKQLNAFIIDQDDFFSGIERVELSGLSPAAIADRVIQWERVRDELLTPLLRGQQVTWIPFDWDGEGSIAPITSRSADVVILEGTYSFRPEFADLVDVGILLDTTDEIRFGRLQHRDGDDWRDDLFDYFERGESWYFDNSRPFGSFDLVVEVGEHSSFG